MTKICPYCKTSNDDDETTCQNCGKAMDEKSPDNENNPVYNTPVSDWWRGLTRSKKISMFVGGIFIIGLIMVLSAGSMINSANQANANINQTNTSTGNNFFENKYVQFTYPNNLVVKDLSSNNQCTIYFFTGNPSEVNNLDPKFAGDISNVASNYMLSIDDPTININLHGTPAVEFNDSELNSYDVFVPSKNLLFEIAINQQSGYNIIKNSLVIKNG